MSPKAATTIKTKKYNFSISRCTKDSRKGIATGKKETKIAA